MLLVVTALGEVNAPTLQNPLLAGKQREPSQASPGGTASAGWCVTKCSTFPPPAPNRDVICVITSLIRVPLRHGLSVPENCLYRAVGLEELKPIQPLRLHPPPLPPCWLWHSSDLTVAVLN